MTAPSTGRRWTSYLAAGLAVFGLSAVAGTPLPIAHADEAVTTASGLKYIDVKVGEGASPEQGDRLSMHYTGWLYEDGKKGRKFDSSLDRGRPFQFPIGVGVVIKGWDEGVSTMKQGGKRTLIIPPDLGYGARGVPGAIPPDSTLVFDVELLDIKK